MFVENAQRGRPKLRGGVGLEQMRAAINRVDWLS
jgi:hypothetical protein